MADVWTVLAAGKLGLELDFGGDYAALNITEVYGFLDDRNLAFEWLQKAIELQDGGLMEARLLPGFAALRDDSRWTPFLAQAGLTNRTD